ncbi:hypothetical protein Pan216_46710 [Planctomycetes bacterium Pan216]|uniref:Glycosyltransferase RgtA/B/C/D-like domain-containing protein n=1 Tax=Kolteria novifilia TaxID=2527975 RepID=A0A518B9X6_9BACT|nr:hypothetical protein Pan216_46710 [Planctomycetes bacterium Pan216]
MSEAAGAPPAISPRADWGRWLLYVVGPLVTTAVLAVLVLDRDVPLGVLGEWTWNRMPSDPSVFSLLVASLVAAGYLVVAVLGEMALQRVGARVLWAALPVLLIAGGLTQWALLELPPQGVGLERWPLVLTSHATSGYLEEAHQLDDLGDFVANYQAWLARQGPFHMGTHPPGLIIVSRWTLDLAAANPWLERTLPGWTPRRLRDGFLLLGDRERASARLVTAASLLAMGTWLLSLATTLGIFALGCASGSRAIAWRAACIWPLVPSVLLFLPKSDCLYPLIAIAVVVLWPRGDGRWGVARAFAGGVVLWLGLMLSLAFLAIVPIVGLVHLGRLSSSASKSRWLAEGAGGLLGVLVPIVLFGWWWDLDLIAVWRQNLSKHAGFYEAMPRSYATWVVVNLVEFAAVTGPCLLLPALAGIGARSTWKGREWVHVGWVVTLMALNFSGRNLSEVARLWIFLAPFACVPAARVVAGFGGQGGLGDLEPGHGRWCWLLAGEVVMAMILVSMVEPLLPVTLSR